MSNKETKSKKKTKKDTKKIKNEETKLELFLKCANFDKKNGKSEVVTKEQFKDEYDILNHDNGGSWNRKSKVGNLKFAVMDCNGVIKYRWDNVTEDEKKEVEEKFTPFKKEKDKSNKLYCFCIFGYIETKENGVPPRQDIKNYYKKKPCVVCGKETDIQVDHKNGLYNNPRVNNTKTQKREDFQSLCQNCNCQKRQAEKKSKEQGKRYGATNIPSFKIFGIDFIEGDETLDINDPNAMVGTYWYDPVNFNKRVKELIILKSK